jgi:hypothetical protein
VTTVEGNVMTKSAAAHELGHAFAMRETGLTPERLVVKSSGAGYCQVKEERIADHQLWGYAVGIAAGQAGAMIWREEQGLGKLWDYGTGGPGGDEELFAGLYVDRGTGESFLTTGSWDQAVEEAQAVLLRVWDELHPLVIPLAVHGRLDGI